MKLLERVGKSIRENRKERGLTQEELAEKADINPKFLGQIERSETNVSLITLSNICEALEISLCELLAFTSMDKRLMKTGELSSEIWALIRNKNPNEVKLAIDVFRGLIQGIDKLSK